MNPIFHLLIPVFILWLLGFDKKLIVYLSPFVFLPDVEYYTSFHRYLGHNFLVVVIIVLTLLFVSRKENSLKWQFSLIPGYYLLSHLVLDLHGGVALFYPFSNQLYFLDIPFFIGQIVFVGVIYVLLLRKI